LAQVLVLNLHLTRLCTVYLCFKVQ
jgi:hypothetical protein